MRAIHLIVLVLFLTACAPLQAVAVPSASSSAVPSEGASQMARDTATASPSPAMIVSTPEPVPDGISIAAPGPDSQVTSPIQLQAQLQPGSNGLVRIELAGRDGRLLARTLLRLDGNELVYEIPFEVRGAEAGRLSLSIKDEYGRTTELASVTLTLLPPDGEQIIQAPDPEPGLVIESPQAGVTLVGGVVVVSGQVRGSSTRPLTIQLITRQGRVLAADDVYTDAPGADGYSLFVLEMNVEVGEENWVLVVISRSGGDIAGLWFVESREVRLLP